MDIDFVEVFEYGMFLIGGIGIGIDRFIMLFINILNICDVILFFYVRIKIK